MNSNIQVKITESTQFLDDETIKTGCLTLQGTLKKIANGWAFITVSSVNYSHNKQVKIICEGQIIRRKLTQIAY